jgi:hypothetical protein
VSFHALAGPRDPVSAIHWTHTAAVTIRTEDPSAAGARRPEADSRYFFFDTPDKLSDLGEGDTPAERRRALSGLHHPERQETGLDVDRRRGPAADGVEE